MAATTPTLSQTSQQPGAALTNSSSLSRPRPSMAPPRVPLPRASVDQPDKAANGGEVNPAELDMRFEAALKQMDLPVDKARILRSYDAARKWELVLDRERVTDHGAPRIYVDKLATFLADNKKTANKKKQKKLLGTETSTGVLKHLEISLRTNSINWVHEFLADECNGLKVLVEYMKLIQDTGGLQEPPPYTHDPSLASTSMDNGHSSLPNGTDSSSFSSQEKKFSSWRGLMVAGAGLSTPSAGPNQGVREDDIHVCILCLRAIMNNKHGFNMVLADPEAIYCIARSILHHSMRTKAMTLELLAAICLVKGGHELVTTAFDRFKWEYQERDRFQTLMAYFRHPPEFHIDFMVFCMQFINIVVHSVQDMNHRVFMQHEFTRLGLDDMLEELCDDESELRVQMQAYKNNMYDVNTLCQDAKLKDELFVEKEELESELSRSRERQQEMEANYMVRSLELDRRVNELKRERDSFAARHQETNNEVHTLRRTLNTQEKSAIEKQRAMEQRIRELENVQESLKSGLQAARSPAPAGSDAPSREPLTVSVQQADAHSDRDSSGRGSAESGVPADGHHRSSGIWQQGGAAPPPPPNVPPPPPPPPPSALAGIPAAPPPPPPSAGFLAGGPNTSEDVMTIKPKRRVETKHKLPMFNWSALKPNQVKDTIFSVLDDDKIMPDIDFAHLEEYFRVSQSGGMQRGAPAGGVRVLPPSGSQQHVSNGALHASPEHKAGVCAKKPCLLDVKRLQNVGISRRRLAMSADEVMCAVHRLDLHALSPEQLECLQRIAPQEDELKSFREYENSGKPLDALTDEEQFVMKLCKIERLQHKLNVMSFMANFEETVDLVEPQFTALTAASGCVRDATKLHRLLEVILAYGNYMNSARRGGVYGFRLQSLDTLSLLRSPVDKSLTLLHLITETVREHFPDLLDFDEQLKFIDKASTICLEALSTDCRELEAGYALAQREHALKAHDCPPTLVAFLRTADERIGRLRDASKLAQESYASCADFYGEPTSNRPQPAAFFSILTNFVRNFKHADADNLQRAKEVEQRRALAAERERVEQERKAARAARQQRQGGASPNKPNLHSPNGDADSELEAKLNAVFKSSQARARGGRSTSNERSTGRLTVRSRDELGHGALDDIISSLREEPYVVFEGGGGQTANGAPNGSSVVGGNRSRASLAGRRCLPTDVHRER